VLCIICYLLIICYCFCVSFFANKNKFGSKKKEVQSFFFLIALSADWSIWSVP